MNKLYISYISETLSVNKWQVEHCIELIEEGATVPFISRYRKERTGSLDEVQVAEIKYYHNRFTELDKRKQSILTAISDQGLLTDELKISICDCIDMQRLEDIYLPYKPKRRTRASIATEMGLKPLAELIYTFGTDNPHIAAEKYINDKVVDVDSALSGAKDIIAEWISESADVRESLRGQYLKFGSIVSHKHKDLGEGEESKYRNYFSFSEPLNRVPAHRLLAILRGESEKELKIKIDVDQDYSLNYIKRVIFVKGGGKQSASCAKLIDEAIRDSYTRLLHPSIENEVVKIAKEKADIESIKVFGENLTALLLAPPLGRKRILAIDPGYRTGCKVVVLSSEGELLHNDTIFPHPPVSEKIASIKKISNMVESYKVEVIAIGNGTASRETEAFIKKIPLPKEVKLFSVSEDGASVYSASPIAREEFPNYDVTVRGAVSIGRRAMDPLAELVKIDPKSLGIGQYQHDVDQTLLKEKLDATVVSCVNRVGVNLNTASKHLLQYVSGIGPVLAQNIVEFRANQGAFNSRAQLMDVKRLGAKAFEQCAGFLRISDGDNPLDNTSVHPERYSLVEQMAKDKKVSVDTLIKDESIRASINIKDYISESAGEPTLNDIMDELSKPGRDPRSNIKVLEFSNDVRSIEDVKEGMILPGIVTNITNFGAFVDIGVGQDGLIHISQLSNKFISSPSEVVKLHQHVRVKVLSIDIGRSRIQLTMKDLD